MKPITAITHEVDREKLDIAIAQAAHLYDLYAGIRHYGPFPEEEAKPKEVALASLRKALLESGSVPAYIFVRDMCGFRDIAYKMDWSTGWDVHLVVTQIVTEE